MTEPITPDRIKSKMQRSLVTDNDIIKALNAELLEVARHSDGFPLKVSFTRLVAMIRSVARCPNYQFNVGLVSTIHRIFNEKGLWNIEPIYDDGYFFTGLSFTEVAPPV